jgi:hypothetical protein
MRSIHSILFLVLICTCTPQMQDKADEGSFPVLTGPYLGQEPPGLEPKIFAPGIVSSEDRMEHASLTVSPDLNEIYWGSVGKGILFSRIEIGRWSAPRLAEFATTDDAEPMFLRDGRRLFFISNRPLEGDPEQGENIWYVERGSGGWSQPSPLDTTVNGEQLHWQISFAEDGTLYFASRRSGTLGNDDIFISKFVDGRYLRPQNAGEAINSAAAETCPFIAYDNSYLLFAALNRPDGYGSLDIYISFRHEDGSWSKAINIGPPVNTGNHEISAEIIERMRTRALSR